MADTKLLLHINSDFTDSSLSGHTPSVNGATIDTGVKKFGAGSGQFDAASSHYVSYPDSTDWTMGNGDFTVDCWFRSTTIDALEFIFGQVDSTGANVNASFYGGLQDGGAVWGGVNIAGVVYQLYGTITGLADGAFHHMALVRNGADLILFADGVIDKSISTLGTLSINDSAYDFSIGRMGERVGNYFGGHVDEFRILKGVAGWTSDFSSDLPTGEYGSADNTEIGFTPAGLTFGSLEIDTTSDLEATITATGSLDLTVSGLTVDNNFYTIINQPTLPFTITALGSTTATVRYSPTVAQTDTGNFTITSDADTDPILSVPLYGAGITIPDINATPMSLDYGNVNIGNTSDLTTTISNTGTGILTVSGITVDNNVYTIISPISVPFILASAGSTVSTIRFTPTDAVLESGTFSITSDDSINSVIGLTLSGIGINGLVPEINVTSLALTFGDLEITTTYDLDTTIQNTGTANLTVSGLTVDNNFYTIISPTLVPFVIAPAGSTVATIRYSPITVGNDTGNFDITSDDLDEPTVVVTLDGTGITVPDINATPMSLDYGNVNITTTTDLSTTISNTGTGNLIVSGLTVDNNMYTIISPTLVPFNLAVSGSTVATVRFSPIDLGSEPGTFSITSNDAINSVTGLTLSGVGTTPEIDVSPTSLNYGSITVNSMANLLTTISNIGTGVLTVSGLTVDNDVYTIVTPTSVPFTVPVSGSIIATIRYSPVVAGTVTGNFTITSDDTDEPAVIVALSGSGNTTSGSGISTETLVNFNLYVDQARGFTSYLDQSINFDLEL